MQVNLLVSWGGGIEWSALLYANGWVSELQVKWDQSCLEKTFFPILFSSAQSFLLILSFSKNPVIERNSPSVWQWQAVIYVLLICEVMDISWLVVGLVQVIVWPLVAFSFYSSPDYFLAVKNMSAILFSKHMCNYVL